MRADASRNLQNLLRASARLLAEDPATPLAEIAKEAGVVRSTLYRRFPTREDLLEAVYTAKLDDAERALEEARPATAPFAIAVHRFVENIVAVGRRWPVDLRDLLAVDTHRTRHEEQTKQVGDLVDRGVRAGVIRADLPSNWARDVLISLVDLATHQYEDLPPGPAADLVTEAFLQATGTKTGESGR